MKIPWYVKIFEERRKMIAIINEILYNRDYLEQETYHACNEVSPNDARSKM